MFYLYRNGEMVTVQEKHGFCVENGFYWDDESIKEIPIYEETPELINEFENNPESDLTYLYDPLKWSWIPVDIDGIENAYKQLQYMANFSLYEFYNDL